MPRARGNDTRIIGIEDRGTSHRVRFVLDGERGSKVFANGEDAKKFARGFRKDAAIESGITVEGTLIEYMNHRESQGYVNHRFIRVGVRQFMGSLLSEAIATISVADVQACYDADRTRITKKYKKQVSASTQRLTLGHVKRVFGFAVKRGYLKVNPVMAIEAVGRVSRRKPQVETSAELARFHEALWLTYHTRTSAKKRAIAAAVSLVALHAAFRPGEVLALEAKHIDQGDPGHIVCPGSKTENARRHLRVADPDVIKLLLDAAKARPTGLLFPISDTHHGRLVKEIALAAGIECGAKLMPHSLRGMASSIATKGDAALRSIADALGHGSISTTLNHYVSPSALAQSQANTAARILGNLRHGAGIDSGSFDPAACNPAER